LEALKRKSFVTSYDTSDMSRDVTETYRDIRGFQGGPKYVAVSRHGKHGDMSSPSST
jgi:hypothetical protein